MIGQTTVQFRAYLLKPKGGYRIVVEVGSLITDSAYPDALSAGEDYDHRLHILRIQGEQKDLPVNLPPEDSQRLREILAEIEARVIPLLDATAQQVHAAISDAPAVLAAS